MRPLWSSSQTFAGHVGAVLVGGEQSFFEADAGGDGTWAKTDMIRFMRQCAAVPQAACSRLLPLAAAG
jgi:hypothetical protein